MTRMSPNLSRMIESGREPPVARRRRKSGFSAVDVPDQQTVDTRLIHAAKWDNIGVSIQLENPELLRDTGSYVTEPLNDTFSTAYNDLGATEFACDEGAPVCTYPNTVGRECYDVEISQSVPTPRLRLK